jgi:hypothetical protein
MQRLAATMLLVLCAAGTAARAADEDAPAACPGAVAWADAHPDERDAAMARRDAARTLTDPALRAELDERVARDQEARIAWLRDLRDKGRGRAVNAIDDDNIKWLYALVRARGFPSADQVGERGVRDAWLLSQHADRAPGFQAELLPALAARQAEGELAASDYARFVDRVLVAQGKPQRYGTQFKPEEWAGKYFGLPDEAALRAVDAQRRELGVMPLADYVCMTTAARKKLH